MKPILLSLLLLPLASCTTTKPAPATSKVEAPARGGRHHRHKAAKEAAASAAVAMKPYPLKTCLVTGDKFDPTDEIVTTTYKGQEIKLCCRDCLKKFKKDPEKYMAKLN